MARRKQEEEHENHERWMVSYADFLTLLFAFFVVMYAISSVNEGKYRVLSESIVSAFRNETVSSGGQSIVVIQASSSQPKQVEPNKTQDLAKQRQREKMRNVAKDILEVLAPLVQQGKVRVLETTRGVTIEINDSILFSPGQAQLHPTSVKAMQAVAEVLAASDFPIIIEGHTDNVPINTLQFPSNWELSAVRATTVLRLFADAGVGAERLTAIGYGETRPVEPNLLAEGRARNRRVTIMIESVVPEKGREVRLDAGPADAPAAGGAVAAGASQTAAR
ncbi:MAG: flagellar motor protein MotD [Candidatus Accumulibacter sp. 66-26]|nr:flagellar motor protein MotD [Accumulibacter sp.]OJW46855.1 MAG: flagellar motor protein MotD [Candidatus Accumulibacter sp. 66-26]